MKVRANGIDIEVVEDGSPSGEPLLLIMGLGMQLIAWPEPFVQALVQRGFRVIRFDNRDAGLSQDFDELGVPNLMWGALRYRLGLPVRAPYTLDDMADDALGVLDALGIAKAHVCGASMGGMIGQALAARAPHRVLSLTLMLTSSGARHLPQASLEVQRALLNRPKRGSGPQDVVGHLEAFFRLIGSPAYPADPKRLRELVEAAVRRAYRPAGQVRQLMAVAAHGDRSAMLAGIRCPVHIVHGAVDPLIPQAAAHDLATKIRSATLDVVDGMGHDLPVPLAPRFAQGIVGNASRA